MTSFDEFVNALCYFGGNLASGAGEVRNAYQDLETFVLDATLFMGIDPRVTQCFLVWLRKYGVILSPSKLRRIAQLRKWREDCNGAVFGAFLEILEANNRQNKHWGILRKFACKKEPQLLFSALPRPPLNLENALFKKFGYVTYTFHLDDEKYLAPPAAVLARCPEIRFRALGLGIAAADLRAFREKHPDITSLYEVAKRTHHPRASIYQCQRLFEDFGTAEKVA
ncbi:hypothetical protein WDW86_03015 [Bdellovibrionota bacterium FG-2]